ncbi:rhm1-like protein [Cymbomonas tetramitiformis]|uniref:UDP-glucose 4,6-dehydratase n=1 Tax=Cymbomonas tetramitiformis TaxID=36881 RepID=A0AAE0EXL1_9CHLO|nr:rhm1-like protein [Cymbomonas tetramitiformis]
MATYEPKNILLTGGAGFICSHVVYRLVTKYPEYKIVVLDKLDYCASLKNLKSVKDRPNFKFVKGDIGSADLVSYVLASDQIDTIMHFAAQTHVDNSFGNSFTFTENNILGTHVLLESAKNYGGIKRFIHVSTDEVYGETSVGSETGNFENNALEPTNPYSATKAGAEMLVKAYQTSYGLPCIVTRGNNVYGPHQFPEKLIPKFVLLALRGQKLPIHGDGSNTRSYMFVEDVAAAFEAVLLKGEVGTVYNIGTQKERTVKDVAESICTYFKLDQEKVIQYVENRPFNDLRYYLDNSKLRGLGWEETTEWADGIKKTIEWFKLHGESGWWETDIGSALIAHPRAGQAPKMHTARPPSVASSKFLIFGKTGWIGGQLGDILSKSGVSFEYASCRLQEREKMAKLLDEVKPTHVLNAAGVTGRPNVDWCETHKIETLRTNVIGVLNLCDLCEERGIHMTNYATGCIFEYDKEHPEGSGIGFKEEDEANFVGSFYSFTKALVESLIKQYEHVLTLRVRMPITHDLTNPRNFVTKIANYDRVVNIPNSMTVLDELLPVSVEMANRKLTGIFNFTNPGAISHNEVLQLYKEYVDPNYTWDNFTLEEQAKVITAPRSNNELDVTKMLNEFPQIKDIRESFIEFVFKPYVAGGGKPIARVETSAVAPPSPSTPLNLAPEKPVPASCAVGAKPKFLIFGRNGWIGGLLGEILKGQGEEYQYADCRLQERSKLEALIDQYKPTHVLNAAGVTGRPNVDWCESHKQETIRTNVVGVLTLCDVCTARGIHMTNFATGCIFEYDKDHPEASGIGFKEGDKPNFVGSFYSFTKALVESIMLYEHVLTLRVRMPITHDLTNTRNFITKIVNYDKVVDIPNSMTVLDELLPYSVEMAKRRLTGIYNFTNPGVISHNQVLQLYKEHVDPSYTWSNFTLEEQSKVIVAPRSNNELDVTKLKEQFPEMKSISESLVDFVYKPYIAGGGKPVCTTR